MKSNQHLTQREKDVLTLGCFSTKEISQRLGIAHCTVATHLTTARNKLIPAVKRTALLIEAIKRGEIDINDVVTE